MDSNKQPNSEHPAEPEFSYFKIQSIWGVTKHFGGMRATERLAELCHISKDSYVLEVGCGVGLTSCHLAARTGCRILGVDLSEKMVEWSRKRAARKGLEHLVEYRVADAQELPFEDATFDAMLCESVTAFVPDQARAIREYRRVVKPGGYVGLNEGTWMKGDPPKKLYDFIVRTMENANFLTFAGWRELLESAGLMDIVVEPQTLSAVRQRLDEISGLDFQDNLDRLRALGTFLSLYAKNAPFRNYARQLMPSREMLSMFFQHLGYGLFAGRV